MAVGSIAVTEGSGKNLWTDQRTVSSVAREAQYVLPAENAYPTFSAVASNISIATSLDHIIFVQADGTNYTRLRKVEITATNDIPAAASVARLFLRRTTTAGSGGGAVTAAAYDTADSYAGTIQTLPTAKGTDGSLLWDIWLPLPAALGDALATRTWVQHPNAKPIIFGTGTGAGITLEVVTGIASATVSVNLEFSVTPFL